MINKDKYIEDIVCKHIAQAGKLPQQDKGKYRLLTDLIKTLNIAKVKLVNNKFIDHKNYQN